MRDFAYHEMSVVGNLYLQRSLVASLPYGSHLCCGEGALCFKLPWLRNMEIAHMEGGVRNIQFRLCFIMHVNKIAVDHCSLLTALPEQNVVMKHKILCLYFTAETTTFYSIVEGNFMKKMALIRL